MGNGLLGVDGNGSERRKQYLRDGEKRTRRKITMRGKTIPNEKGGEKFCCGLDWEGGGGGGGFLRDCTSGPELLYGINKRAREEELADIKPKTNFNEL